MSWTIFGWSICRIIWTSFKIFALCKARAQVSIAFPDKNSSGDAYDR